MSTRGIVAPNVNTSDPWLTTLRELVERGVDVANADGEPSDAQEAFVRGYVAGFSQARAAQRLREEPMTPASDVEERREVRKLIRELRELERPSRKTTTKKGSPT